MHSVRINIRVHVADESLVEARHEIVDKLLVEPIQSDQIAVITQLRLANEQQITK